MMRNILCYGGLLFVIIGFQICENVDIAKMFRDEKIVPYILPDPPTNILTVTYPTIGELVPGMNLTYSQARDMPNLTWPCDPNKFYFAFLIGLADFKMIKEGEVFAKKRYAYAIKWNSWAAYNIRGNNVSTGDTVFPFVTAGDPGNLLVRDLYIFLAYEQKKELPAMDFEYMSWEECEDRKDVDKCVKRYELIKLVAGNFFYRRCYWNRG